MITTIFQTFAQEVEDFILGLFKIIRGFLAFFGFTTPDAEIETTTSAN